MKVVERWSNSSGRVWDRAPALLQIVLVLWVLIGLVVAFVPDLQKMPSGVRFAIGLPAALALLWMIIAFFLSLADKLIALGKLITRKKAQ